MSNSIKLTPLETPGAGIDRIEPLLLPTLDGLYRRRAERLRQLAEGHAMADYLGFSARVAEAQQQLLDSRPLPAALADGLAGRLGSDQPPLACTDLPRDPYWRQLLQGLIEHLQEGATPLVQGTLADLRGADAARLEIFADALLAGDYARAGSGRALFLWGALSLYWTQLAAHLPASGKADPGEQRQFCPVCASAPVASVVLGGAHGGLRYLHCGLCESRWHLVRVKCSNCEQTGHLDYWSLDSERAAIKAESCGDCHSYLKVLYLDRDAQLEVIADDLASLALDAEMEREGFARSGVNPFLLPG